VIFFVIFLKKLHLINIANNFFFKKNLMLQVVFREDKELDNNIVCENLKIKGIKPDLEPCFDTK